MKFSLDFLSQQKIRVSYKVSHLNKVIKCKSCNCVRIRLTALLEFGQDSFPIVTKIIQQVVQDPAILESRVHTLTIKRYNPMSRVADQDGVLYVPGITSDGDE